MAGLRMILDDPKSIRFIALGEALSDKLPGIPARTQMISLFARATFGGIAAAKGIQDQASKKNHAVIGATAAVATAVLATAIRLKLGRRSSLLGFAGGIAEDWVVAKLRSRWTCAYF